MMSLLRNNMKMKNIFLAIIVLFLFQQVTCQQKPEDYLKAMSQLQMENYDSSLHYFNKAIAVNSSDYTAIFNRGMLYYAMSEFPAASKDFRLVNKRFPGKASLMLSKTEAKLNHLDIAIKYLREHLESNYKIPEKEILLDPDFNKLEGTLEWKKLWREKEWYRPNEIELQEARYLMNTEEHLEALNALQALEKQGSNRSLIFQYKAEIYLHTGNKKAAMEELTKSIKSDYRNLEALNLRANMYYEQDEFEDALSDCKNILRQNPASFEHYILSAKLKNELNDYDGALKDMNTYLELFPAAHNSFYETGNIHFAQGRYLNAIASYNRALGLYEGNANYYYARGRAYAATGTHKYAERDFSMSLDLDPLSADTWYAKGLTDMELGHREKACFDFRKAMQYGIFEARDYIEELCK